MNRWMLALLLVLLVPGVAAAGRAGNIRLSRPLEQVAVGQVPVYLQALQHGEYPVGDATVTIQATDPTGKLHIFPATLDPAFGNDYVYLATVDFALPGTWVLTIMAGSSIHFEHYRYQVKVLPTGSRVEALGPLTVYQRGAERATPVQVEAPKQPAYTRAFATSLPLVGAGMMSLAVGGFLWFRRRSA